MKIRVINGPNLNLLGVREPDIYGKSTYHDLCFELNRYAAVKSIELEIMQSNHEGDLLDWIQESLGKVDGIVINAAAYTHSSIALLDALKAVNLPTVEVHLSVVKEREEFRQISYLRAACCADFSGKGIQSYLEAIDYLERELRK